MGVLEPIMHRMYNNFTQNDREPEESGMLFMEWLSCLQTVPKHIAKAMKDFDPQLEELLLQSMVKINVAERGTLAMSYLQCGRVGSGKASKFAGDHA